MNCSDEQLIEIVLRRKLAETTEALAESQRREAALHEHYAQAVKELFYASGSGLKMLRDRVDALTPHPTTNPSEIDSSLVVPQGDSADGE